jgi:hypothetical protein
MRRAGALLALLAAARAAPLGDLVSLTCANATCALIAANPGGAPATVPLRLAFFGPSVVRWWLAVDGNFSDTGAASDVIVAAPAPVALAQRDAGAYFEVTAAAAPGVAVRLQKAPLLLSIYVGGALVVQEAAPLAFNATHAWQTLARDAAPFAAGLAAEYYFGGGMQNGRFSHRDERIEIAVGYDWDDGGHPNPVPFFVSSAGYAVLRNTWSAGEYTFGAPVVTVHAEPTRLDAFILLAGSGGIKALLGLYTNLTGPPFMPPIYALGLGDSDCYHNSRHGNSTQVAVAVAKLYREYDMPGGWMLPNDGYGCGYGEGPAVFPTNLTDLTSVVAQLHELGFYAGLWTSTGMPNIAGEVGVAGTRVCKTDVGWIGDGCTFLTHRAAPTRARNCNPNDPTPNPLPVAHPTTPHRQTSLRSTA